MNKHDAEWMATASKALRDADGLATAVHTGSYANVIRAATKLRDAIRACNDVPIDDRELTVHEATLMACCGNIHCFDGRGCHPANVAEKVIRHRGGS